MSRDPEKQREYMRRWRKANPEKRREQQRRYYQASREKQLEYRRRYGEANGRNIRLRRNHGLYPEDWEALLAAQDGCCYLCGDPLPDDPAKVAIDHDHRCCGPETSCRACRLGLAHSQCNRLVGLAGDDPARLRRIADNRAAAMQRIGPFPEQPALFDLEDIMDDPDYTAAAVEAMCAALDAEHDFAEWVASILARVAARAGSTEALTAGRPGSWEAALVDQLVKGTVGYDDEYLPDPERTAAP